MISKLGFWPPMLSVSLYGKTALKMILFLRPKCFCGRFVPGKGVAVNAEGDIG